MKKYIKERKRYQDWGKGYYHLSSDGWHNGKLFHTPAQFAYGMILMGLLTLRFKVVIYDFALMDNHIHILLSGTGAECVRAFDYYRMKLSARLVKNGCPPLPEDYGFKLTPITDKEQMRIAFMYVDRNPLERGLCLPGGYPWGAAWMHCSQMTEYWHGQAAGTISVRDLIRMTGSRTPIPATWEFHPKLGLLPSSYINNTLFNRMFPSPKDYQTRLVKDYEAFVKVGRMINEQIEFSRNEMLDIVSQLAQEMFPGKRRSALSNDEKGRLCVALEDRFGFSSAHIADVLTMSEYVVKQFLASKDYGIKKR